MMQNLFDRDWDYFLSYGTAQRYVSHMLQIIDSIENESEIQKFRDLIHWYGSLQNGNTCLNIYPIAPIYTLYRARVYKKSNDIDCNIDKSRTPFKGYNAKDSFIPPKCLISEGRANDNEIVCLYVASNSYTATCETMQDINDTMSIASIRLKEYLYVLNFSVFSSSIMLCNRKQTIWIQNFALEISKLFQLPCDTRHCVYKLCQIIADVAVKELHLDGISYYSSKAHQQPGITKNINFAIYNYKKCEPVSSELVSAQYATENMRYR